MRKPKKRVNRTLNRLRQSQSEATHAQNNYRIMASERLQLEQAAELQSARIAMLEEQRRFDHILIEHLVETAKLAAAKGVQSGVMQRR